MIWEPMHGVVRLVAILLAITLAGGAQACAAICATPLAKVAAAPVEKPSCHHCPEKADAKSDSAPTTPPCKQCQVSTLDRVSVGHIQPNLSPTVELAFLSAAGLAPTALQPSRASDQTRFPPVRGLPTDRLHEFCLLLI